MAAAARERPIPDLSPPRPVSRHNRGMGRTGRRCAAGFALAAALALVPPSASAQDTPPTVVSREGFSLHTHCSKVDILVEEVTVVGDAEAPAAEEIRAAAAARLEAADILGPSRTSYVQVGTVAGPRTHAVTVRYHKALFDPHTRNAGPATTWRRAIAGAHAPGEGTSALLAALEAALDEFTEDYLTVNRADCLRR